MKWRVRERLSPVLVWVQVLVPLVTLSSPLSLRTRWSLAEMVGEPRGSSPGEGGELGE